MIRYARAANGMLVARITNRKTGEKFIITPVLLPTGTFCVALCKDIGFLRGMSMMLMRDYYSLVPFYVMNADSLEKAESYARRMAQLFELANPKNVSRSYSLANEIPEIGAQFYDGDIVTEKEIKKDLDEHAGLQIKEI